MAYKKKTFLLGKIRKRKSISQKRLAELLKVSSATISNWENEFTHIPAFSCLIIAKELGVKVEDLFIIDSSEKEKK